MYMMQNHNECSNEVKNKEAHQIKSNKTMKKLMMEMTEKIRKQTRKTVKIMLTLQWNVILL